MNNSLKAGAFAVAIAGGLAGCSSTGHDRGYDTIDDAREYVGRKRSVEFDPDTTEVVRNKNGEVIGYIVDKVKEDIKRYSLPQNKERSKIGIDTKEEIKQKAENCNANNIRSKVQRISENEASCIKDYQEIGVQYGYDYNDPGIIADAERKCENFAKNNFGVKKSYIKTNCRNSSTKNNRQREAISNGEAPHENLFTEIIRLMGER